jgi:catechol 2,3-dioxygenase-like lactoylglutathione lyase family enzyme
MQKSSTVTDKTAVLRPLGNIHHLALRCRDAEQTRWFYEDVLGLPLAAALSLENSPGTEKQRPFLHLFLELGDGNYIAFFDEPGHARASTSLLNPCTSLTRTAMPWRLLTKPPSTMPYS